MSMQYPSSQYLRQRDRIGSILIFLSTVLLGIWAVKDTIALRNICLVLGASVGMIYIVLTWKAKGFGRGLIIKGASPLIMLALLFVWMLMHYLFLSRYPHEQFQELTSTWLRSFMAVWLALGTALAITKRPHLINWLWFGIFISFLVLLLQYIPKAIVLQSLFAPEYYGSYIFRAKINGVLAGTIMLAGLAGSVWVCLANRSECRLWGVLWIWLAGLVLALYAYVFIFEARNGVGLTVLIFMLSIIWTLINLILGSAAPISSRTLMRVLLTLLMVLILVLGFGTVQATKNAGWQTLFGDVQVAIQIDKYPNWQDPAVLGYPQSEPGHMVAANTYERVAWATAGITQLIPENPLGIGVLSRSFPRLLEQKYGKQVNYIPSTHSAWVDFTLSYGIPGIVLLLGSLLMPLFIAIKRRDAFSGFIFIMSASILLTYTVGEVSTQHGVELLLYLMALLAGLTCRYQGPKEV